MTDRKRYERVPFRMTTHCRVCHAEVTIRAGAHESALDAVAAWLVKDDQTCVTCRIEAYRNIQKGGDK